MKRLLIILIPLLVIPLIGLSLLAWSLAGRAEDQLLNTRREQHVHLLDTFKRDFDNELNSLTAKLDLWVRQGIARTKPETPPILGQAWVLLFDDQQRWWYPWACAEHLLIEKTSENDSINDSCYIGLSEASRDEHNDSSPELAAEKYQALVRENVPDRCRAKALLGWARCLRKMGKFQKAQDRYQQVMDEFSKTLDETGINFGAQANSAYMSLIVHENESETAIQAWREYAEALLSNRYPMGWVMMLSHLTDALAFAPPKKIQENQDRQQCQKLEEAVKRLEAMSKSAASIRDAPAVTTVSFQLHEEQLILSQPVAFLGVNGWVVAAFDIEWIRKQLIEPLIGKLNEKQQGRIVIQDNNGRNIVGQEIPPHARTSELSLSHWGLLWTAGVGFPDFADFKTMAMRRNTLLSGSIIIMLALITIGVSIGWRMIHREIELSKLKSDFVDNVSHELRTPTTSIKLFSEMLMSSRVDDPQRQQEYYSLLSSEANRLSRMVENMLNFSRIMAGRMHMSRESTEMAEYLTNICRQLEIQARPTGHRIRLHLDDELPACHIDRDAISRAVANLIANAIKYSPDEREIILTAQRRDDMLGITVRDKGIGISNSDLPHVFDRFYRAGNSGSEHIQGTGLGLTIVKDTVERHQGTVRIESQLGKGTVVELLIPVNKGDYTS
ncbi:MAG: ATP-binding protein [Planctomycetota bacterium]|jgi:signal transduction histidine kinase